MTDLLVNKFKERAPHDTIELIKKFFHDKKYTTKIYQTIKSEAGTYSCVIQLFKNDLLILQAQGKGMSDLYSQASGFAELYERFCNQCYFIRNPFFQKRKMEECFLKNGYYLHPEEHQLTYNDVMAPHLSEYFYKNTLHNDDYIKTYFSLLFGNIIFGEPFIDLINPNNTPYYNQSILNRTTGSIGMCAGNSVAEALNQGISEICEHMATDAFFNHPQTMYYQINPLNLNTELQSAIAKIEQANSAFYIFDLSYNFNLPVVMSLLINKTTKTSTINFGSFPIFDIAVERIITEIYQGVSTFEVENVFQIQSPFMHFNDDPIQFSNSLLGYTSLNEDILLNKITIVDSYNTDVFLTNVNSTNEQINKYFINLFKQLNYSIHYINNSLSKDLAALYVIIPEYDYTQSYFSKYKEHINSTDDKIKFNLIQIMKLHKLMNMILSQKISSNEFSTRLMELQQRTDDSRYDGNLCGKLTFVDWLNLISNINTQLFMLFGYNYKTLGLEASQFTFFYEPVKYYLTLQKYVAAGYSYEKIKSIFLIMFNNNVSLDDFNKCFDREYLDRKICLEPLQNYWNSQDFLEIVHSVIKE